MSFRPRSALASALRERGSSSTIKTRINSALQRFEREVPASSLPGSANRLQARQESQRLHRHPRRTSNSPSPSTEVSIVLWYSADLDESLLAALLRRNCEFELPKRFPADATKYRSSPLRAG